MTCACSDVCQLGSSAVSVAQSVKLIPSATSGAGSQFTEDMYIELRPGKMRCELVFEVLLLGCYQMSKPTG